MFSSFLCSCSSGCLPSSERVLRHKDFSYSNLLLLLLMKTRKTLISACTAFQRHSPSRIWLPPMMQETHFADGGGGAASSRLRLRLRLAGSDKQKRSCVFNGLVLGPTAGSRVCSSGWKRFSHMSPFYGVTEPIQTSSAINENSKHQSDRNQRVRRKLSEGNVYLRRTPFRPNPLFVLCDLFPADIRVTPVILCMIRILRLLV